MRILNTSLSTPIQPLVTEAISRRYQPSGMGFVDPATALSVAEAGAGIISKISNFLGIGKGRMEADQITPYQDEISNDVLAPISAALNSGTDRSASEWQTMYNTVVSTEQSWLRFLHDTEWFDGRAAVQAEATLAPYFDAIKQHLQLKISEAGGFFSSIGDAISNFLGIAPQPVSVTQPALRAGMGSNLPLMLLAGVALWFFVKKGRSNGV
jgi:hypothetical protein